MVIFDLAGPVPVMTGADDAAPRKEDGIQVNDPDRGLRDDHPQSVKK